MGNLRLKSDRTLLLLCVLLSLLRDGIDVTAEVKPSAQITRTPTTESPGDVQGVEVLQRNDNSVTLRWNKVNNISTYVLQYVNNGALKNDSINATEQQVAVTYVVSHLTAARKYNFTLKTRLGTTYSDGHSFPAVTAPESVRNVTALTQTENSITLRWEKVDNCSTYVLQYGNQSRPVPDSNHTFQTSVTHEVSSLPAGKTCHFTLVAVFENVSSDGFSFQALTAPPAVTAVNATERTTAGVTLTWRNMDRNWSYVLHIDERSVELNGSDDVVSQRVPLPRSGTEYPFQVTTMFSGLNSSVYSDLTVTAINCTSVRWQITNASIRAAVRGSFSGAEATNGSNTHRSPGGADVWFAGLYPGAAYRVSLVYEKNNSTRFLQCSVTLTTLPPDLTARCEYWAAGYSVYVAWDEPDGAWTAVELNVTGRTFTVGREEGPHVKISGFQPAKTYKVSVSSLSGSVRSSRAHVFQCSTDPRGVIAGSVLAVLLFGLLAYLATFLFLRRTHIIRNKPCGGEFKLSSKESRYMSIAEFPDHFNKLSVDVRNGFFQEYKSLAPVGRELSKDAGLLPENQTKNRFTNVLPYDWCRVKLETSQPDGTSDYINASYMPGYRHNREYIATQGPLPATIPDFWRMIWEKNVKGVVMVTNCEENGHAKCEQYWPALHAACLHGDLLITTASEQQGSNWTLRDFRLKHRVTTEESTVKHFHFTAWPDHGVPQGTQVLVQFRQLIRQHVEAQGAAGPTVVHCSAGVGRTGTIIALDVALQQVDHDRVVDINNFVAKMRQRRPLMVQTQPQYVFLHQCVMDYLQTNKKMENLYENQDIIYVNAPALGDVY